MIMDSTQSENCDPILPVLSSIQKLCPRCQIPKSMAEFPMRHAGKRKPNSYCRPCQRDFSKEHYRKNSLKHNKRRRVNMNRYARRNRRLITEYLALHPCVDCGESDPIILEFDHI